MTFGGFCFVLFQLNLMSVSLLTRKARPSVTQVCTKLF